MGIHRSFIAWLLVIGLVGVYTQSFEELSTNDLQLDESSSARNLANEDSVSVEDLIAQQHEARIHKRSDPKPSTSGMSQQDFEWHITEGTKSLKRLSETTAIEKQTAIWKKRREEDAAAKEAPQPRQSRLRDRIPTSNKQTQTSPNSSSRRS